MNTILVVLQVLIAIALVAIILVQRGAGATAGVAFGSGASATVFGSQGAGSFLTKTTAFLAIGFFSISLFMAITTSRENRSDDGSSSVMSNRATTQPLIENTTTTDELNVQMGDTPESSIDIEAPVEAIQSQSVDETDVPAEAANLSESDSVDLENN